MRGMRETGRATCAEREQNMPADLDWLHKANDIPAAGLECSRRASEAERVAIAEALTLLALKRLDVHYRICPLKRDRFLLRGELSADIEQICSVSLDPLEVTVEAQIEVEFWSADKLPKQAVLGENDTDFDPFAADDPEPISAGKLEVGRIVYEQLASAIEPYPRHADAELEQDQAPLAPEGGAASDPGNPFAVLSKLKSDAD